MADVKTYSVTKIPGWKLYSYNYFKDEIKEKTGIAELTIFESGKEVQKLYFQNEKDSLSTQANSARNAKRKITEFLNKKKNEQLLRKPQAITA